MVTITELKAELKEYSYDQLTEGDDAVGVRCLEKARNWASAKLGIAGVALDETDPVDKEIVLKRALYELYAYGEQEAMAQDKKDDAWELMRAAYGLTIDDTNQKQGSGSDRYTPASGGKIVRRDRNVETF